MNYLRRDDALEANLVAISTGERLDNVTPGEVLRHEFMELLELSARQLARELDVPPNRITAILNGTRAVTAETALLFAARFGTSPEFWLNLQNAFDLEAARAHTNTKQRTGEFQRA